MLQLQPSFGQVDDVACPGSHVAGDVDEPAAHGCGQLCPQLCSKARPRWVDDVQLRTAFEAKSPGVCPQQFDVGYAKAFGVAFPAFYRALVDLYGGDVGELGSEVHRDRGATCE